MNDRNNWKRIAKTIGAGALGATLCLGAATGCSDTMAGSDLPAEQTSNAERDGSFLDRAEQKEMDRDDPRTEGILELANEASFETLDASSEVGLDVRAAENIVATRREDGDFETLTELDDVDWVSDRAFGKLYEYAMNNGYVDAQSGDDDSTSDDDRTDSPESVHGVDTGSMQADGILRVANSASKRTLDATDRVGLDARAADNIVAYRRGDDAEAGTSDDRRFEHLPELASVDYVAARAFEKLGDWAAERGFVSSVDIDDEAMPDANRVEVDHDGHVTIKGIGARRLQRQIDNHFEEVDGIGCGTPYRGETLSCTIRSASAHGTDSDDTLVEMTDGPGVDHLGTLGDRFSCHSETTVSPYGVSTTTTCTMAPIETLAIKASSDVLPRLGDDYVWEAWVVDAHGPDSLGQFERDFDTFDQDVRGFAVSPHEVDNGDNIVLTIEPAHEPAGTPSQIKYLAGRITDGEAVLTTRNTATIDGADLSMRSGTFFLAAPSGRNNPATDYRNGIWFIDKSNGGPASSLDLPKLGDGWTYEGWVVGEDGPVSTGRFDSPAEADSDRGGPFAGRADTPPFPGQDFIAEDGRRDLSSGYKAVVTVEPKPDFSPKPFTMKPLAGSIDDAGKGTDQSLGANPLPTAGAKLE